MYRTLLGVSKEFVHIVKAMEQRESTAPCKDVSKEFVLIGCVLRKRSVFILYFTHPHLFNENKLRTHTLQSKVRYFHVTSPTAEPHAHQQGAVHFFPAQFAIINPPE